MLMYYLNNHIAYFSISTKFNTSMKKNIKKYSKSTRVGSKYYPMIKLKRKKIRKSGG